ncbi:hypothetical protein I305_03416 [Cryptococcus gattii E566]|uniref:t-SNARE coiled-coil homology domain-containing protein n=1 Tax=Cryptococcus gattii EJB2 TaxID=1296103 RepID=A0ABR5BZG8_9TREE|nr:hypothetical protein I306_01903 [Cryptococcus gattii EJB2]KIY34065.1 hypothetical protein I305_03416 [Cryptococcus gattii E566]KJE03806.1 hypothetical protein I311_02573 [Cryptococcus gattii NT-10]
MSSDQTRSQRLKPSSITSSPSPTPKSAPPIIAPPKRRIIPAPLTANSLHPVEKEIERLTSACEEHERVIRSTLSTVRHHIITNAQGILERLSKVDDDAETLQSSIPQFQSNLRENLQLRSGDVELMRERTTPWKDVVDEDGAALLSVSTNGIGASHAKKLKRVEGGGGEADALTRVELWADEVEMYLNNEIIRVNESTKVKRARQIGLYYAFLYSLMVLGIIGGSFLLYNPSAAIWEWMRE